MGPTFLSRHSRRISRLAVPAIAFPALLTVLTLAVTSDQVSTEATAERIAKRFRTVSGAEDIVAVFRPEQDKFNRLSPPAPGFRLRQPCGILLFGPKALPAGMAAGLIEGEDHGFPVYLLVVAEDPATREIVFANADGKEVYAAKPEPGYDPWAYLRERYPDMDDGAYPAKTVEYLMQCYDPARVQAAFTLLPVEYAEKYATALAEEAAASPDRPGGGMAMMRYSGPPVTNLQFTAIEAQTNGMLLTLAYPDGFTNRVDFFTCTNLVDFWWDLAATTNVNASTNWIEWLDGSPPDFRLYAAGNADTNAETDPDGDSLTWAREMFLYHSSPTNYDTDGDGSSDYTEAVLMRTDPCNGETNMPAVSFLFPTNGAERVWVP